MVKLLPNEAEIYKAMTEGRTIRSTADETGIAYSTALNFVLRLIEYGMVVRTGNKKNYICKAIEVPYEVVNQRNKPISEYDPMEDKLIVNSMDIRLTDHQLDYLRNNKSVLDRRVLAKHLKLTKMQLNFAIMKMG
jgi:hypothetical protein